MRVGRLKILSIIYVIVLLALILYSYSQIDLNLTLSSNSLYQTFQKQLIYLGYFNRPLSTFFFLLIIFSLYAIYYLLLRLVVIKKLSLTNIFLLIIGTTVILLFSYPAFSHDIFNYMFDARIVTKYHTNPYFYSATDFPHDLWIRFMHWTHRVYPYGPVWLFITLPFSFLGFGKFVITLFLFKLMFSFFHLGNIILISKILAKVAPKNSLKGIAFYAFNPLILIESLVSPHNEVMMLFFLLAAIYIGIVKKNLLLGLANLFLSAGVKFATIVLLPLFLRPVLVNNRKKFSMLFKSLILILTLPVILQIMAREPYPWYFIPFVGLGALLPENKYINIFINSISTGALLRYAPFLYNGEYSAAVVSMQYLLFVFPTAVVSVWIVIRMINKRSMV